MVNGMIDSKLLKSRLALSGVKRKAFAQALKWSMATAHRKINGKAVFTVPEMHACVKLLSLDAETANRIFFANEMH